MKITEKNTAGIYIIEILGCKNFYIGSSKDLKRRNKEHLRKLIKNKHDNQHLQNAFNKYGKKSYKFSILVICENNKDFLLLLEQRIIDYYNWYDLFNISKIAGCPENNKKNTRRFTEEDINKIFYLVIDGKTLTQISKLFNVSLDFISRIIKRSVYSDIKIDKIIEEKAINAVRNNYRNLLTKDEEEFILLNYLKIGPIEISKILNRNFKRIIKFAKENGLVVYRVWSKDDEEFLIKNINKLNREQLCFKLNKTKSQINSKINRLTQTGIKLKIRKHWSEDDINYLIDKFKDCNIKDLSVKFNRTENAIIAKYYRLKDSSNAT